MKISFSSSLMGGMGARRSLPSLVAVRSGGAQEDGEVNKWIKNTGALYSVGNETIFRHRVILSRKNKSGNESLSCNGVSSDLYCLLDEGFIVYFFYFMFIFFQQLPLTIETWYD